jgi:hypothetical protein
MYDEIDEIILINKLIESSKNKEIMWEKIPYPTYNQYYYKMNLTKNKSLNFKLYHYFIHDNHLMNIYYMNNEKMDHIKSLNIFSLYNLIKVIRENESYFIKK